MPQHIHCTVSNCHYYGHGNKCMASEIVVVSDEFGVKQPDNVDATQASTSRQRRPALAWKLAAKPLSHPIATRPTWMA